MESIKLEYKDLNFVKVMFNSKTIENFTINQMRDIKDLLKDAIKEIDKYIK